MFIVVLVTVPERKKAEEIAKRLLSERLCACVNIVGGVTSFYWWKAKIENSREMLLVIKTRRTLFKKLKNLIKKIHPYSVPEIIGLPIVTINEEYASWLREEMQNKHKLLKKQESCALFSGRRRKRCKKSSYF